MVVRPEPGLGETLAALRERELVGIAAPMQRIVPRALRPVRWARVQAVLLTSGQAVPSLAAERASLPGRAVLAVGDATARRARDAGLAAAESASGDAEALRRLARERLRPRDGALLLCCGAGHALRLAAALRADGFRVLRRVAYRTEASPELPPEALRALAAGGVGAALFFSADGARAFRRGLRRDAAAAAALNRVRALAISAGTAAVLRGMGWAGVEAAAAPNAAAVLALLEPGG